MTDSNALAESFPFNHKPCTVAGYDDCWVRFKTSGYPRKLRKEWDRTTEPDKLLEIVLTYVEAWKLRDVDGHDVEPGRDVAILDNIEDAVVVWLIMVFKNFWLSDLPFPRKNS